MFNTFVLIIRPLGGEGGRGGESGRGVGGGYVGIIIVQGLFLTTL